MGNIIFLLAFLLPSFAIAQDVNLLQNSNFESRLSRWSKTGSSTLGVQSASPLEGSYSADWDPSATGEFLRSNTYTIQEGLKGRRCSIEMEYLWDSGVSGEILMNVDDGTNNVATVTLSPTTGGVSQKASQTFECPTSGSLRFELESTANAASIRVDKMYLGSGKNTVQISQANFVGGMENPGAATCFYSQNTSTGFGDFVDLSVGVGCASWTVTNNGPGTISAFGANDHRLVFTNMQPGNYRFELSGQFFSNTATPGTFNFRLSDGTNTYQPQGGGGDATDSVGNLIFSVRVDTPGTRTYKLQSSDNAAITVGWSNYANLMASWKIYRYPLSSAEALTLETTGSSWSGYHDNTCSWSRTSASYGDPTADASCNLVEKTNDGFGVVSAVGSTLPAISFTPRVLGKYFISAILNNVQCGGTNAEYGILLTDGTSEIAYSTGDCISGGVGATQMSVKGLYNVTSLSPITIRVHTRESTGAIILNSAVYNSAIEWSIFPISQQMPAPVYTELQNLVKSSVNGIKIYSAIIANGGTPAIGAEHGGDWILSLTDNGVGDTTINFQPGIFTVQPACTCVAQNPSGDRNCIVDETTAPSSSLTRIQTGIASTGADTDLNFHIICTGP